MAINKTYRKKHYPVIWQGEEIATVTHLGGSALIEITSNMANQLVEALTVFEEAEFSVKGKSPDEVVDFLKSEGPDLLRRIGGMVPDLITEIAAYGCGVFDDLEAYAVIKDEWSAPMQIEVATAVLRATFIDEKAVRTLVGNVAALLKSANALTGSANSDSRNQKPTDHVQPSLADG